VRNPQDKIVPADIISGGTPGEVGASYVVEADDGVSPKVADERMSMHLLSALAKVGAHVRVLIKLLLLARKIDDAVHHPQLFGYLPRMCFGYHLDVST
jgi:hypothetical protein